VLQDLVEQVDASLGSRAMPAAFDEARELDFIERCTNESMRLRPVAPVIFLENNRDTVLDGIALPEGTLVICLMRRPNIEDDQQQDALEFRPARWLQASAANEPAESNSSDRDLTKASMPFGAGPRMCPGRYLAMLEMKMVLSMLFKSFELIEVGNDEGSAPQERLAFTMFPVGLRMKIRERRAGDIA
jgi:cytochrome P450